MLIIREAQMRAFEAAMRQAFEDRMVLDLAMPDESAARQLIRYGIEKCLGYGIDIEADMQLFLQLMATRSPDFEQEPGMSWALGMLRQPDLSGSAKASTLFKRLNRSASLA